MVVADLARLAVCILEGHFNPFEQLRSESRGAAGPFRTGLLTAPAEIVGINGNIVVNGWQCLNRTAYLVSLVSLLS